MPRRNDEPDEEKEMIEGKVPKEKDIFGEEIKSLELTSNSYKSSAEDLKKYWAVINEELNKYRKDRDDFEKKKTKLIKYLEQKNSVIAGVVKEKKGAIDKEINKYDEKIKNIEQDIKKWEDEKIPKARMEFYAPYTEYRTLDYEFHKLYDTIRDYDSSIKTKLGKLEKEQEDIDKLDETQDGSKIYVRLNEFSRILEEIELKSIEDLKKEIFEAWKTSNNKEKEIIEKRQKKNFTIEECKEKIKTTKELKKARLKEILSSIGIESSTEMSEYS